MAFDDEQLRISCSCGGEEIAVSFSPNYPDHDIGLSFWEVGRHRYRNNLPYIIKQIIHFLRKGHPYTDMVILNSDEARKLGAWLLDLADARERAMAVKAAAKIRKWVIW